jgi:hypothetical protein
MTDELGNIVIQEDRRGVPLPLPSNQPQISIPTFSGQQGLNLPIQLAFGGQPSFGTFGSLAAPGRVRGATSQSRRRSVLDFG